MNEIALQARERYGSCTDFRSITTCNSCFTTVMTKHGGYKANDAVLAGMIKALIMDPAGMDTYLVTYAKHLERRLRDLEMETSMKDVTLAKMEVERDECKDKIEFLEKLAKQRTR
jgi:hypothetical protein